MLTTILVKRTGKFLYFKQILNYGRREEL